MIQVTTSPQDPLGHQPPKPCPNCGHCPTCGQTPPRPYYYPYYPNTGGWPYWWGGIQTAGTITASNITTANNIGGTVGL